MQLTLTLPDMSNITAVDAQIMLAVKLFETKKLSMGKAAEVAGLSYRTFYELLLKYDVPVFTQSVDDIRQDMENVRRFL
jgi:predicted HTH domain antitoxin